MALLDDFKARFPEFDTAQADQFVPILEPVWPCYYGGGYEDCNKEIVLNLLAHMIVSEASAGSGNTKSAASKSVGNISVSYSQDYAPTSERNDWLRRTKYGMRYLTLTQHNRGAVWV